MLGTTGMIQDTQGADIWVMKPDFRFFDDALAISDDDVFRVRSLGRQLYRGAAGSQLNSGR